LGGGGVNYILTPLRDGGWVVRADSRFAPDPLTPDEARRVLIDALEAVTDQRAAERRET
jgi:hypothetical protein